MRSGGALALVLAFGWAGAAEPPVPAPRGFVTDLAGVIAPATEARLGSLLEELRRKTGAEIAVLTVDTTEPLDDFTYAMRVAEAWRPGRRGEDTGVLFLVAVRDRRLRILVGYGLEGTLPDGLVGELQDRVIVPAFRAGRLEEGIERGVAELASRIAAARGATLAANTASNNTRAAVGRDATVTGANDIVLSATADPDMTATSEAGTEGDETRTPSFAVLIGVHETTAEVVTGPTRVELDGLPGWHYLYRFADSASSDIGVHSHYFLFDGDRMVVLVLQALPATRFAELADLFDDIALSLRVPR